MDGEKECHRSVWKELMISFKKCKLTIFVPESINICRIKKNKELLKKKKKKVEGGLVGPSN